jgi:hypothetical protein
MRRDVGLALNSIELPFTRLDVDVDVAIGRAVLRGPTPAGNTYTH